MCSNNLLGSTAYLAACCDGFGKLLVGPEEKAVFIRRQCLDLVTIRGTFTKNFATSDKEALQGPIFSRISWMVLVEHYGLLSNGACLANPQPVRPSAPLEPSGWPLNPSSSPQLLHIFVPVFWLLNPRWRKTPSCATKRGSGVIKGLEILFLV